MIRFIFLLCIWTFIIGIYCITNYYIQPEVSSDLVLRSLERNNEVAATWRTWQYINAYQVIIPSLMMVVTFVGVYWSFIKTRFSQLKELFV